MAAPDISNVLGKQLNRVAEQLQSSFGMNLSSAAQTAAELDEVLAKTGESLSALGDKAGNLNEQAFSQLIKSVEGLGDSATLAQKAMISVWKAGEKQAATATKITQGLSSLSQSITKFIPVFGKDLQRGLDSVFKSIGTSLS